MSFQAGDKVWVKSLVEIEKIADGFSKDDGDLKRYHFPHIGFDFIPDMYKYCGKQVTIKGNLGDELYSIQEDSDNWRWSSCWFSKNEPTSMKYVSDFGGTIEETTPAEVYWEQVMPQIKEFIINAYNKGVEIGKAECL